MSTTTAAVTLTNGIQAQLVQPGGGQYGAVVVSNTSQFELVVQIGADTAIQQAFTAMLYTLPQSQQAPVNLNPYVPMGAVFVLGQPNQVTATWYTYGEQPQGTWPFSFTGQAIQSGIAGAINATIIYSETILFDSALTPGGNTGALDVSKYASLLIHATGNTNQRINLAVVFTDTLSDLVGSQILDANGASAYAWRVPVIADTMAINNNAAQLAGLVVIGTNRPAPNAVQSGYDTTGIGALAVTGAWTANTPVTLGTLFPPVSAQMFAVFQMIGVTGTFVMQDATAQQTPLANDKEMLTWSNSVLVITKAMPPPRGPMLVIFVPAANSGSGTVALNYYG